MRIFSSIVLLWTLSCTVLGEQDRVLQLPGLPGDIPFRLYSGYLNASEGKYLHYMFAESTNDPPNDPLVLWLNGGPGCSSLLGFWTEQGPFRVQPGGKKVEPNPWAWNKIANMLFLESPPGVGFSYSDSRNYTTDDDIVSMDNLLALKSFFKKFSQYRQNDLYLTGESYAGVYIPTLSVRLLSEPDILYKGFAIGNGYLDQEKLGNSKVYFAYYHGLIDHVEWTSLTEPCCANHIADEEHCEFVKNPNPTCNRLVANITNRIASYGLNPYNVYDRCDSNNLNQKPHQHQKLTYGRSLAGWNLLLKPLKASKKDTPVLPCVSDADLEAYLNTRYVRKVLHIPSFLPKWTDCNEQILDTYGNIYKSLKKQVLQSLNAGIRGMIYNGDIDMVCDFLGDQWFVEDLGIPAISEYQTWHVDNQTAGFVKHFQSNLTLVTVRGAGHMVPTDRPVAAFKMFQTFLEGHKFV